MRYNAIILNPNIEKLLLFITYLRGVTVRAVFCMVYRIIDLSNTSILYNNIINNKSMTVYVITCGGVMCGKKGDCL